MLKADCCIRKIEKRPAFRDLERSINNFQEAACTSIGPILQIEWPTFGNKFTFDFGILIWPAVAVTLAHLRGQLGFVEGQRKRNWRATRDTVECIG